MQSDTAYALLIGISEYRYMGRLPKAVVDVKDLHEVLLQSGYISSNVQKLLNNDATKSNIDDKLGWLARSVRSRADSTVLIYFSGHGLQRAGLWSGEYLCPIEANPNEGILTLITSEEIVKAIQAIKSNRIAVFLDACHAGAIGTIQSAESSIIAGLSESTYEQLAHERGRVIIASCLGQEEAHELSTMRNGLFAHSLLEGLRGAAADNDGTIHINKLFSHVRQGLDRYGLQHPFLKAAAEDFVIALTEIVILLNKYCALVNSKQMMLIKYQKLFAGKEEIWPNQCVQAIKCVNTVLEATQQVYNQLDNTARLPQQIYLSCISLLEALRKVKRLISDDLIPCITLISGETPVPAAKLRNRANGYFDSLLEYLAAFVKLIEELSLLQAYRSIKPTEDYLQPLPMSDLSEPAEDIKTQGEKNLLSSNGNSTLASITLNNEVIHDYGEVDAVQFQEAMQTAYGEKELKKLCFRLEKLTGEKYDNIRGNGVDDSILNLIQKAQKRDWYAQLVEEVLKECPHLVRVLNIPKLN
jgi:hypothetical protein